MNIKRIFGTLLTSLGIGGLIYEAFLFSKANGGMQDNKNLIIYGILSILFFASGISLVRNTRDES